MKIRNKQSKKINPISDGDARPDMQPESFDPKKLKKKDGELTKSRAADIDTSEDYKDAK